MKLKIRCPSCGNDLIINVNEGKVVSIEINNITTNSQKEIAEILERKGIELG